MEYKKLLSEVLFDTYKNTKYESCIFTVIGKGFELEGTLSFDGEFIILTHKEIPTVINQNAIDLITPKSFY